MRRRSRSSLPLSLCGLLAVTEAGGVGKRSSVAVNSESSGGGGTDGNGGGSSSVLDDPALWLCCNKKRRHLFIYLFIIKIVHKVHKSYTQLYSRQIRDSINKLIT